MVVVDMDEAKQSRLVAGLSQQGQSEGRDQTPSSGAEPSPHVQSLYPERPHVSSARDDGQQLTEPVPVPASIRRQSSFLSHIHGAGQTYRRLSVSSKLKSVPYRVDRTARCSSTS